MFTKKYQFTIKMIVTSSVAACTNGNNKIKRTKQVKVSVGLMFYHKKMHYKSP